MSKQTSRSVYLSALMRTVPTNIAKSVNENPTLASLKSTYASSTLLYLELLGFREWCETPSNQGDGLGAFSKELSAFFARLLDEVFLPYGGCVVHFGGSTLSVLFRDRGHALRAATSALRCRSLVAETVDGMLEVRVGLSSGKHGLVTIGDEAQKIQILAGKEARVAVRLQESAAAGEVLCDAATESSLREQAAFEKRIDFFSLVSVEQFPNRQNVVDHGETYEDVEAKITLLEPFVAPSLRMRLMTVPEGWRIEGQRRPAVVMFIDAWGLLNIHDSEDAKRAQMVAKILRRYRGVVQKVELTEQGHRLMVTFGLSRPDVNDAERACLAGLEIIKLTEPGKGRDESFQTRVGIHHGEVFSGAIGSQRRHDITCVGDVVHFAARLAKAAEPTELLVSAKLLGENHVQFKSMAGPDMGQRHVVRRVLGVTQERSHYVKKRDGGRDLCGRKREAKTLQSRMLDALEGDGGVVEIRGPAGSGKSAQLSGAINRWLDGGGVGMICRCHLSRRHEPLAPVVSMFRSYLGATEQDGYEALRARALTALKGFPLSEKMRRALVRLIAGEGVTTSEHNLFSVKTDNWNDALEGILAFVKERSQQEPVLYIVDDLHNADALTLELCRRATLDSFTGYPAQLIFTHRGDSRIKELSKKEGLSITLSALELPAMTQLIANEVGASSVDPSLAAFIWRRSQGLPGPALEIVAFLRERSLLLTTGGQVKVSSLGLSAIRDLVPEKLSRLALAKFDRLSSVDRRILRWASAVGTVFAKETLLALGNDDASAENMSSNDFSVDEVVVDDALARLVDADLIWSEGGERERFRFQDEGVRAVAYKTLPKQERREVHRRVADALECSHMPRSVTLAFHRERAGQTQLALDAYADSIQRAARSGLDEETVALIDRWRNAAVGSNGIVNPKSDARMAVKRLIAVARQGAPRLVAQEVKTLQQHHWDHLEPRARRVVDLWVGASYLAMGKEAKAETRLSKVYRDSSAENARGEAARLLGRRARLYGAHEICRQWVGRALELSERSEKRTMRAQLESALLELHLGNIDHARVSLVDIKERARRHNILRVAAHAGTLIGACAILSCDFERADEELMEARGVARAVGSQALLASVAQRRGQIALFEGRYEKAQERLEEGYRLAKELGEFFIQSEAAIHLGAVQALSGQKEQGLKVLEDFERKLQGVELFFCDALVPLYRAQIHKQLGDKARAKTSAACTEDVLLLERLSTEKLKAFR